MFTAISVAIHGLVLLALLRARPEPATEAHAPPLPVALIEDAPAPETSHLAPEPAPLATTPGPRTRQRPPSPAPEVALPQLEPEPPEPAPDEIARLEPLPEIDPTPSVGLLMEIAGADPRVRRMLRDRERPSIFERARLRTTNLPPDLDYARIRAIIAATWSPEFVDVKDESISEVSVPWVRRGLKNWLTGWQEELKRQGLARGPPALDDPWAATFASTNPEAAADSVAVELDLEPLSDGTWAVSIAVPSDHPFFDRRALESVREAAAVFPPWAEGYGSAVRYRLDARFVIVPPSLSTLLSLSYAFPFCTPEELQELEVYYWFKKLVRARVDFLGLAEAPPRDRIVEPDAGPPAEQRVVAAD